MRLPRVPDKYIPSAETTRNRVLEQEDALNHKRNRDVEIGDARLILTSPNGTRYSIEVANDGTVSASAV